MFYVIGFYTLLVILLFVTAAAFRKYTSFSRERTTLKNKVAVLDTLTSRKLPKNTLELDSPLMKAHELLSKLLNKTVGCKKGVLDVEDVVRPISSALRLLRSKHVQSVNAADIQRQLRGQIVNMQGSGKYMGSINLRKMSTQNAWLEMAWLASELEVTMDEPICKSPTTSSIKALEMLGLDTGLVDSLLDREVTQIISACEGPNFDVFSLDEHKNVRNPLLVAALFLFQKHELFSELSISAQIIHDFFIRVDEGYSKAVNYHTRLHATDVLAWTAHFVTFPGIKQALSQNGLGIDTYKTNLVALFLAAAIHDFKHDGYSNGFHKATNSRLAFASNDRSPLENMHLIEAFSLLKDPKCNIFEKVSDEQFKFFRATIIELVLNTDLAVGLQIVNKFKLGVLGSREPGITKRPDYKTDEDKAFMALFDDRSNRDLLLSVMLCCADIGHPLRPLAIHKRFSDQIMEEFWGQGDKELELGLAISPLCNRNEANMPKSQIGFVNFVVKPKLNLLIEFCQTRLECNNTLKSNLSYWQAENDEIRRSSIAGPEGQKKRKSILQSLATRKQT